MQWRNTSIRKESVDSKCIHASKKRVGVAQCGCQGPVPVYHCLLLDSYCILKDDPVKVIQLEDKTETKDYTCCEVCIHKTPK